ncbi:hypothetical protein [Mariniluteicoccus flavus]
MSSDRPDPDPRPTSTRVQLAASQAGPAGEDDVATRVQPMVDGDLTRVQPSVDQPEPAPPSSGVAWDDPATRAAAQRRLLPTVVAAGVGVLALVATVVLAVLGVIQQPWGLWVLVVLAGLAGGCIAGALAGWAIEAPLRRLLKAHPWERLEGRVGLRNQLVVVADNRRRAYDLDLTRGETAGELGDALAVRACGPRDEKVVELGPKKRWRLSERVAVMMPDERDLDELDDDDDWQPTVPKGEQPDADGLYAG